VIRLIVREERWPLAAAFVIARGAKTEAHVVVVELELNGRYGRGESVPYMRYGETVAGVLADVEGARGAIEAGADAAALQGLLAPGAARNALDCAFWDLEAKTSGLPAWRRAGVARPGPRVSAVTLSLDTPGRMGEAARALAERPQLKLKLGGPDDVDRVEAVRAAAPHAGLIVDANEALTFDDLRRLAPELARLRVGLIEQPLPAGKDEDLEGWCSPVPLCADESLHTRAELGDCARRYACINVKLDKAGGLTEALHVVREARGLGVHVMVGCMVATSLAIAPALLLAADADWIDLDGPLLLARDRTPGLHIEGSRLHPPEPALWG
jgi:L-alanine-DL-glutamate epimerase-like enolase superfamily enzyme